MINITDPPPTHINVCGENYLINYDFKAWIEVSSLLQDIDFKNTELYEENLLIIAKITYIVFGEVINQPANKIIEAVIEFFKGYPKVENGYSSIEETNGTKLYSFKHDINYIVLAIRNQSGIDLSYKRQQTFHWWDFMLEFQSLEENHYISRIIGYRGYKGNDKDYLQLKKLYTLPKEQTRCEQELMNEVNDIFYGC